MSKLDELMEMAEELGGSLFFAPTQAEVDQARAALQDALKAVVEDADRYRWLREQDWFSGELCVLKSPKAVLTSGNGLGADCPSRDRLDAAIDAARKP